VERRNLAVSLLLGPAQEDGLEITEGKLYRSLVGCQHMTTLLKSRPRRLKRTLVGLTQVSELLLQEWTKMDNHFKVTTKTARLRGAHVILNA
jgi:hypothetical protein